MNKQANILFIPSSSKVVVFPEISQLKNDYYQQLIHAAFARDIRTTEEIGYLSRYLASVARHAYLSRRMDVVSQTSQLMLALPGPPQSQAVGRFYEALCLTHAGKPEGARPIFEVVAEIGSPQNRARALNCIGMTYCAQGQVDSALPFLSTAARVADGWDPLTLVEAHWMIAIVRSVHGDHPQALSELDNLFPLVRTISRYYPTVYYDYLNSLSVELGEVGRLGEAHAALNIALASPFAKAYPQWSETRLELQAKRTAATPSVVAVTCAPEAEQSEKIKPQSKPQRVKALAHNGLQVSKSSPPKKRSAAPAVDRNHPLTLFTLDRIGQSIKPRAPPPAAV